MKAEMMISPIASIHTDFPTKFGVPRQSGLVETEGTIVFQPQFRNADALRGLEDFTHLWIIWQFSCNETSEEFCPTVRPPRLGGNRRAGVFATRSPFRPNPLGLSCVEIAGIEQHPTLGPVIHVLGADLVDNTPIYDIKPYIPYTDSRPNAKGGFADEVLGYELKVEIPAELCDGISAETLSSLQRILAGDPRPSYHHDPQRIYGFPFAGYEVKFLVDGDKLTVMDIKKI